jgi:hypothetical protein
MRGEPNTPESTFSALSAVLSIPILGDLLKYSISFDGMNNTYFVLGSARSDLKVLGET